MGTTHAPFTTVVPESIIISHGATTCFSLDSVAEGGLSLPNEQELRKRMDVVMQRYTDFIYD